MDEYGRLTFDRGLLETWPIGTLYRIVRTLAWIQAAEWGQDKQDVVIVKNMLLHQIRSRAALRDMHQKLREIWVNPYTSANMEALDLARISQTPEIRKAFPREVAETAGYPVVCWKYAQPAGRSISN